MITLGWISSDFGDFSLPKRLNPRSWGNTVESLMAVVEVE